MNFSRFCFRLSAHRPVFEFNIGNVWPLISDPEIIS